MANEPGLVPVFKTITIQNETKSREAGRPIFDEMEVCEIRFAGDRNRVSVFPAQDISANVTGEDGTTDTVTYAERFPEQYKRFKDNKQQVLEGTPLSELPFLSEAKRAELRALNIHTAEQLSQLDGTPLKQTGQGGRELKNQATAYLQNASNNADTVGQAREIAELKAEIARLQGQPATETDLTKEPVIEEPEPTKDKAIEDCTDDELRLFIERGTGHVPHGNMSREKLVAKATRLAKGD